MMKFTRRCVDSAVGQDVAAVGCYALFATWRHVGHSPLGLRLQVQAGDDRGLHEEDEPPVDSD